MFAPDDRVTLREQLRPDPGTRLAYAVGTTFTLDLNAALTVPLAFAAQAMRASAGQIAVLDAIRSAADVVDVFCQAGSIKVPRTPNDLAAFLEPMIHEVVAPTPGFLFHPKVWVAKYVDADGGATYRLLCGSRNLTDDASWDALVRLDGEATSRRTKAQNKPIVDFITSLPTMSVSGLDPGRLQRMQSLATEIATVEWTPPIDIGSVTIDFHALGLRPTRGEPPIVAAMAGRRLLIVSPFLDDQAVTRISTSSVDTTLVSRVESLERLQSVTLQDKDTRIIGLSEPLMDQDDEDQDEGTRQGLLGGLHAKFYVVEAARQSALFIGSANATVAGLYGRNVEFMIEFRGGPKGLGIDRFIVDKHSLVDLLVTYQAGGGVAVPAEEEVGRQLENYLRRIASVALTATVLATESAWQVTVVSASPIEPPPTSSTLHIGLLSLPHVSRAFEGGELDLSWEGVATTDVTPFITLTVMHPVGGTKIERSTVVRAQLINGPSDRFDEIIAKQFKEPDDFLRFIALLLGLADPFGVTAGGGDGEGGTWSLVPGSSGLFEMLIRAVADRPDAIDELDRLVSRLQQTEQGRKVLPSGFDQLWTTIRQAHAAERGER